MLNSFFEGNSVHVLINSRNTFPTAAGCASSASSGAALVKALSQLYHSEFNQSKSRLSDSDLSCLARKLSGSACRSVHPGFVEWKTSGESESLYSHEHWGDLRVVLVILSDRTKEISSTLGMLKSKETSDLLTYRISTQVPKRLEQIKKAILDKDFRSLADISMRDSNSLHAICRDTSPPIVYMSEVSDIIVRLIHTLNEEFKDIVFGYTFDAGPNAFIISESKNVSHLIEILNGLFGELYSPEDVYQVIKSIREPSDKNQILERLAKIRISIKSKGENLIKKIVSFRAGPGAN